MSRIRKRLHGRQGFTLIELMIVVAIIGLLAAMAVPNYLRMQCRSKRSEAKMNLGGIATAEKTFFSNYNNYVTDLVVLDWAPQQAPRYVYGFTEASTSAGITSYNLSDGTPVDTTRMDSSLPAVIASTSFSTTNMVKTDGSPLTGADLLPGNVCAVGAAANGGYLACAAGDINNDPTGSLDLLSYSDRRVFTTHNDDCVD